MTYDLSNIRQLDQFHYRTLNLIEKGAKVELRELTGRSKAQNSYLHLVLGVVAMDTGNTLAFTKDVYFKKLVNPDVFCVMKDDRIMGKVQVLRSSRDLTIEEMSMCIDRFKRWAADNGIYIPEPEDAERLKDIEMEMGRMKSYL